MVLLLLLPACGGEPPKTTRFVTCGSLEGLDPPSDAEWFVCTDQPGDVVERADCGAPAKVVRVDIRANALTQLCADLGRVVGTTGAPECLIPGDSPGDTDTSYLRMPLCIQSPLPD